MTESSILSQIQSLSPAQFKYVCQKIVSGLGFLHTSELPPSKVAIAFQETIERRSTDGMFLTKESWLLAFVRPSALPVAQSLQAVVQESWRMGIQNVLFVAFSNVGWSTSPMLVLEPVFIRGSSIGSNLSVPTLFRETTQCRLWRYC